MDETDDEIVEIRRAHFAALALEADQVERLESQIRRLESELHPASNRRSACGLRGVA